MVLNLVSRNYVILLGSLMSCIIDKSIESSQGVEKHQIGILCFCRFNEGVVKE